MAHEVLLSEYEFLMSRAERGSYLPGDCSFVKLLFAEGHGEGVDLCIGRFLRKVSYGRGIYTP
jgi:hypothetical protein